MGAFINADEYAETILSRYIGTL